MSRYKTLDTLFPDWVYSDALINAGGKFGNSIIKYTLTHVRNNLLADVRIGKNGKLKMHVRLPTDDFSGFHVFEKDFPLTSEILWEFDDQPGACGIPEGIENQKAILKELKKMVSYMEKSLANPSNDQ